MPLRFYYRILEFAVPFTISIKITQLKNMYKDKAKSSHSINPAD